MTYLPRDHARCSNDMCPLREKCLRWLHRWDSGDKYATFVQAKPDEDGKCDHLFEALEE